jgi:hypothetical protein
LHEPFNLQQHGGATLARRHLVVSLEQRTMSLLRAAAVATLTLAAALATASSYAGDGAAKIPEACRSDAASLCPGMEPGDGKFGKCMKSQRDKVSEGCKAAAKSAREHHGGKHAGGKGESGAAATPAPAPQGQ